MLFAYILLVYLVCLVLSYPVRSCLVKSYSKISYLVKSYSKISYLVKSYFEISYLVKSYFEIFYLIRSRPLLQDDFKRNGIEGTPPPFYYGTHYSCAGYVLHYLLR